MELKAMDSSTYSGPVLAQWHCDAELWQQFLDSEGFDAGLRSARNLAIVPILITPMLLIGTFIGYRTGYVSGYWSSVLAVAVAVLGGVLSLSGLILWPYRHKNAAAMDTKTGDVTIALDGFLINGRRFDWAFGPRAIQFKGAVWRFQNCRRRIVDEPARRFDVLEFEFEATSLSIGRGPSGPQNTTIRERLPVPADKISKADEVASRLNLRFESAKREWKGG